MQKKRFYNALKERDIYKIIYGIDIDGVLHHKQKTMTRMKFPEFLIDLMIDLNQCIREGFAEETTTTVKDITGKDAISFEQFVQNNKGAWL